MIDILYSVEDIENAYGVKSHKETKSGMIAIKKKKYGHFLWVYFRKVDNLYYEIVGSLPRFDYDLWA